MTPPTELYNKLIAAEVDGKRAPDCRRVLRDERFALGRALQSGDRAAIARAAAEAQRVWDMWEGL
jgi:hypothetical protein